MFLFELDNDPFITKLVGVTSQLKGEIDSGKKKSDWTVEELLNYYRNFDIIVDKSDLYDMIKKPPLNKSIANIKGDKVIFKGQQEQVKAEPDENEKIVAQMAKSAMK